MATLVLRGDFLQQRMFHLTDEEAWRDCRDYFIRGDVEDLYDACRDDEFGDYIDDSSYIHGSVDLHIKDGDVVCLEGDFKEIVSEDKIVSHPSEAGDHPMCSQDGLIMECGKDQNENEVKCLVELLDKGAAFTFDIDTDKFDFNKLQFIEDPVGKTCYIIDGKAIFSDRILYDRNIIYADESSWPTTVQYGMGFADKRDGSLKLNYTLNNEGEIRQRNFNWFDQEKFKAFENTDSARMTIKDVLQHVAIKNAETGDVLLNTEELDELNFKALVRDFFSPQTISVSPDTGVEEYKDLPLTKDAIKYLLETDYFVDSLNELCMYAYCFTEGYDLEIEEDGWFSWPNDIYEEQPQWYEIEFQELEFSCVHVLENIDTM